MTVMAQAKTHQPVLLEEALAFLHVKEGGTYVDGTAGGGGHSEAIAKAIGPKGHLVCIERARGWLRLGGGSALYTITFGI